MTAICSAGTYLPPWTHRDSATHRVGGPDEDALTMAVCAGRRADPDASATRVLVVSRDLPLLEGGNGAVLLAGLSLGAEVCVTEILGGAPAVLDEILATAPGTLIIGVDDSAGSAGAAAVLTGEHGASVTFRARQNRSLPVVTRGRDGARHEYGDPRMEREVGVRATLVRLGVQSMGGVVALAGFGAKMLGGHKVAGIAESPTASSASMIRMLIAAIEGGCDGAVIGMEQSSATVAHLSAGVTRVSRDEPPSRPLPAMKLTKGTGIPISLAAYSRAFDAKLRWEAAVFDEAPGIDGRPQFPPRLRVGADGTLAASRRSQPLPRTGVIYSHSTVALSVPDLYSPYSLALVQLDDWPVRVLVKVTGVPAGEVHIGQSGSIVLRRIAIRSGIPDYAHAFLPAVADDHGRVVA